MVGFIKFLDGYDSYIGFIDNLGLWVMNQTVKEEILVSYVEYSIASFVSWMLGVIDGLVSLIVYVYIFAPIHIFQNFRYIKEATLLQ